MTDRSQFTGPVLLVAREYPPALGGLQTLAYAMVRGLSQRVPVHLVMPKGAPDPPPAGEASVDWIRLHARVGAEGQDRVRGRLLKLAARRRARVVAFLNAGYASVLGWRWRLRGPASVVHVAGKDFSLPWVRFGAEFPEARAQIARGLGFASAVVSISAFTRDQMRAAGVQRPMDVVLPGVDPVPPVAAATPPGFDLDAADPLVLCVARLVRRKGHHLLLEAVARVRERLPRLRLVLAGDGEERANLEMQAKALGVEHVVCFAGRVDAVTLAGLYRAADVFCLTPIHVGEGLEGDYEGFGLVYSEAASAGVPSIASRSGGASEAVLDGETGLVVPENDVDALATALLALGADREKRLRLGQAALARYRRELTVEAMIDQTLAIYARAARRIRLR